MRILRPGYLYCILSIAGVTTDLSAQATSWQGSTSSAWRDSTNWQGGIPDSTSAVLVSNGSPSRFDLLVPPPTAGDTARVGDLTIQQLGRIVFAPAPEPGWLIVHGTVFSLNGGEVYLGDGRIVFKNDVQLNRGGLLDAGEGTLEFQGDVTSNSGAVFAPGSSTVVFSGDSDQTITGDMAFANLVVQTGGTLSISGSVSVTGAVTLAAGSTLLVDSGSAFVYDGTVEGDGDIVDVNDPPVTGVVVDAGSTVPSEPGLRQNFPNPFNPATTIAYTVPRSGWVSLTVVDMLGRRVATLDEGLRSHGLHTAVWNASSSPSGTYFCRLTFDGSVDVRRMQLVK